MGRRNPGWIDRILIGTILLGTLVGLAVTALRLLQPEIAATPLLVGFAPLLVPAYAAVLLGTCVVVLIAPRSRGRLVSSLAGVTACALVLHLIWLVPTYTTQAGYRPDSDARAEGSVRVMTINVLKGRAEPRAVRRLLERVRPDVLVLAEVQGRFAAALARGAVTDLPLVAGDAEAATRVYSSLAPAAAGQPMPGRLGWRVPLVHGSQVVQVYGVHPIAPHLSPSAWWRDHRELRQATEDREGPTLIAGDLNATLDHGPVIELQQAGFRDAARGAGLGWAPTWPANGRPVPVHVLALDHVLARGPWTLTEVDRQDLPGTDHQAVWATYQLDQTPG